jgi:hypothetical protein
LRHTSPRATCGCAIGRCCNQISSRTCRQHTRYTISLGASVACQTRGTSIGATERLLARVKCFTSGRNPGRRALSSCWASCVACTPFTRDDPHVHKIVHPPSLGHKQRFCVVVEVAFWRDDTSERGTSDCGCYGATIVNCITWWR